MTTSEGGSPPLNSDGLIISEDLVPSVPRKESQIVALDLGGFLDPPVLLQTNETQCGGQLWPGGKVLAEYLLREKADDLAGKTMFVVRSNVYFCTFKGKISGRDHANPSWVVQS